MCEVQKFFQDSFHTYLLIEGGMFFVFTLLFIFHFRHSKLGSLLTLPLLFIYFSFASLFITGYYAWHYWMDDNRPSIVFEQMNAAIKNTCFVDPTRTNCPQNFEQVLSLYPNDFKPLQNKYVFTYEYDKSQNIYTLIARPKNIGAYKNRVAIFDPRLSSAKTSYDTPGRDFADTEAYSCNGKYQLESPPPFPGPWDKIN